MISKCALRKLWDERKIRGATKSFHAKTNKPCLSQKIKGNYIKIMQDNFRWLAKS